MQWLSDNFVVVQQSIKDSFTGMTQLEIIEGMPIPFVRLISHHKSASYVHPTGPIKQSIAHVALANPTRSNSSTARTAAFERIQFGSISSVGVPRWELTYWRLTIRQDCFYHYCLRLANGIVRQRNDTNTWHNKVQHPMGMHNFTNPWLLSLLSMYCKHICWLIH